MKNIILVSLAAVALALAGCSGEATSTDTASAGEKSTASTDQSTASSTAEMVKCDKCGMEVPKAEIVMADNKNLCTHCAPTGADSHEGHNHAPGETH